MTVRIFVLRLRSAAPSLLIRSSRFRVTGLLRNWEPLRNRAPRCPKSSPSRIAQSDNAVPPYRMPRPCGAPIVTGRMVQPVVPVSFDDSFECGFYIADWSAIESLNISYLEPKGDPVPQ